MPSNTCDHTWTLVIILHFQSLYANEHLWSRFIFRVFMPTNICTWTLLITLHFQSLLCQETLVVILEHLWSRFIFGVFMPANTCSHNLCPFDFNASHFALRCFPKVAFCPGRNTGHISLFIFHTSMLISNCCLPSHTRGHASYCTLQSSFQTIFFPGGSSGLTPIFVFHAWVSSQEAVCTCGSTAVFMFYNWVFI